MAVKHTIFDELIIGSPMHINRTIGISPGSGLLEKCWLTVKENPTQTDSQALIKKTITTTGTADGQITDAGASGSGVFVFHLLPVDTNKFTHKRRYYIDIWVKATLDDPAGVETGFILPHYAVTQEPT